MHFSAVWFVFVFLMAFALWLLFAWNWQWWWRWMKISSQTSQIMNIAAHNISFVFPLQKSLWPPSIPCWYTIPSIPWWTISILGHMWRILWLDAQCSCWLVRDADFSKQAENTRALQENAGKKTGSVFFKNSQQKIRLMLLERPDTRYPVLDGNSPGRLTNMVAALEPVQTSLVRNCNCSWSW